MSRVILGSLFIGVLGIQAWAQPPAASPAQRPPETSVWVERMLGRVGDELGLDEQQRAKFDEIVAAHAEQMRATAQRWAEYREAVRSGDEARAAQLRAELPEQPERPNPMAAVLDEVEPILREDQLDKLWEIQDRMEQRQAGRDSYRRVVTELPEELDLDPTQREEFDRLLDEQRQRMRESWTGLRPLLEQMRDAEQAGDQERAAELRKQIEQARTDPSSMLPAFFEQLSAVLNDAQKQRLAAFQEGLGFGATQAGRELTDVRNVLRAAKRLKLTPEQRKSIKEIEQQAIHGYRQIDRRDREGQARLAAGVKKDIVAQLDAEQAKQFEQQLQRLERPSHRDREP
jgi:hypothetical protein